MPAPDDRLPDLLADDAFGVTIDVPLLGRPLADAALTEELLVLATRLAADAGAFLRDGLHHERTAVETKSTGTDMVSEMDRGAERLIVEGILAARPDDGILGEEGASRDGSSGVRWIVDPLDGTTNYLYGHPFWCVSIGIEIDGVGAVGVVDAPMLRETFTAVRGRGASCNGLPIRASACSDLRFALVATGFAYRPETRAAQGIIAGRLLPEVRDLRRGGSAALDLCFTACGRVDAYYERGCHPWDLSAGTLIVREAGGVVTGMDDDEPSVSLCIAGNAQVQPLLRETLRAHIIS